jgi:GNAT superfamily N-acetyltransferase
MTVVDLRQEPVAEWVGQIVDRHPFLPYWWIRRVTPESRRALMEKEVDQGLADPQNYLLGCVERGALVGFAQMHRLEWDSKLFGVEIYRLDHLAVWGESAGAREHADTLVQAVVEQAREAGARSVQTWVPLDDVAVIHVLESVGFRMMDVLVTWIFDFAKTSIPDLRPKEGVRVRRFQSGDEGFLTRLARQAHSREMPNRFRADPNLPMEACEELYRQWMLNSVSFDLADHISVVEFEGQVAGYSSSKDLGDRHGLCNLRLSQLLLGAIVPEMRQKGLITQALIHNLRWLADKADVVNVGTQANNIAPQVAWANLGFRPARAGPSMHLWLDR